MSDLQMHEIRLALVMNGGVSLAVWMAGITHEIDLVRRATTPGTPRPRKHDEKVAERWRTLLQGDGVEDRRRLVVDVIAGTSAGGLNGALLATAIAHDGTLDPEPAPGGEHPSATTAAGSDLASSVPWLREKWCNLGSLRHGRLIPDPAEGGAPTGSLLDGDFFYGQARQLLTELKDGKDPTPTHPVTLFTTASGLGVQEFTARDAAQQPFTVADHRFLYRFSNEPRRVYDPTTQTFGPPDPPVAGDFADIDRLALAARSSASFPVAFAPRNDDALNGPPEVRRRPRSNSGKASWLIDGGVIDNAPFGPVLAEVAAAPVSGHLSRYVMYVVPSSGIKESAKQDSAPDEPPDWKDAVKAAVGYPREVDFRSDIEELEALRVEAETAWDDAQQAFARARNNPDDLARLHEAARCLQPTYTRGRAAGGVWEALVVAQEGQLTRLDDSAAAPATDVEEILATNPLWTPPEGAPVCPFLGQEDPDGDAACAELPPDAVPRWPWGLGPAERVVRTILRDLRAQTTEAFRARGADRADLADLERHLTTLTDVRHNLRALRTAAGAALAAEPSIDPSKSPRELAEALNAAFAQLHLQEALGSQIKRLVDTLPDGAEQVRAALALDVVSRCMSSRSPDQRSAPFKFIRLGPDVPLPMLTGGDTEAALQLGDRILYGTQVGHFGAFGAEEWRRWDWLMGRLHAVSHLGRLLHDGTPEEADAWIKETQDLIVAAENPDEHYVSNTLTRLQQAFPPGKPLVGSLGEMLRAMNAADGARPVSTVQLGDRLVYSAGGLPGGLGNVVKVAAGRAEPPPDTTVRGRRAASSLIRWIAEPTRTYLWTALTGSDPGLERSRGWPTVVFSLVTWLVVAAAGLALLIGAARSDSDNASILAALGTLVLTLGLVGAGIALIFRRGRSLLARKTKKLLTGRTTPSSSVDAPGGAS